MKNKKQLALAVSLAVLGGTALTTQSLAADVATPSKANELQAGNYVYVTNAINVGTATDGAAGSVADGTQTYSVKVGYPEEEPATDDTLAVNVPNDNNNVTGAMATGYGATATGLLANANGVKSLAYGDASLAFGTQALSYGSSAIAIGTDAVAGNTNGTESSSGNAAIAIGLGSRANENLSLAIGGNAQSSAISSTAIGAFARTTGISAMAIGAAAQAEFNGDVAIGVGSYVNSATVNAVGNAAGGAGLAVGYMSRTTGATALAVGTSSKAAGIASVAVGNGATDTHISDLSVALGSEALTYNKNTIAIGGGNSIMRMNTVATGESSIAVGGSAKARGDFSVGIGRRANALGYKSVAIGENSRAVGDAVAIGNAATVGSTSSSNASVIGGVAIGNNSKATVSYGVKGYDPLNDAVVSEMNTVLTGDNLATYEKNKDAVAGYRTAMENAEKAYKAFDSTYQSKVTAIMNDGTKTDTQKQTELQALYAEKAKLANAYSQSTLWVFATDEGDAANDYGKAAGAWESTNSAFAIGNSDLGLTRQITGVAAGTQDTDAVNVAQLKRSRVTLVAGNNVTLEDATTDSSTGMVYKVNALRTDVAVDNTLKLTSGTDSKGVTTYNLGLSDDLTSRINSAADKDLTTITASGQSVVKNLAREAVAVEKADDYVTVNSENGTNENKTTYKVGLNLDSLKAGLTADENGLATKADVTKLNDGIQEKLKNLSDNQLTADQVKTLAQGSVDVKGGANVDIDTKDNGGVKTFTVSVSDANIKSAVQADLDEKLNKDGTNLTKELITSLKDKLGVNDANQSLDQLNGQIEKAETRIEEAHTRIDTTNTRVDSIDNKVQTIDGRVTTVEGNVSTLRTDVNNISANVSTLNTNVDTLTTNVNTLTTDLGNLTNDVNTLSENVGAIASDVSAINNRVGKLDQRLDKVGASAAALAALHPLQFDEEDKFTVSAGVGNYKGEQAMALGAFYQANEDTLFSVGGTLGDENMVNLGVSLRFGSKGEGQRPSGPKAVRALTTEVASLQAKNASLENTVATQQDRLAQQEAELAAQRQLIEQLVAKVGL